jgi:hypothetical protein
MAYLLGSCFIIMFQNDRGEENMKNGTMKRRISLKSSERFIVMQ